MRANTRLNQLLMLYDVNIRSTESGYIVKITHKDSSDVEEFDHEKLPFAIEKAWKYFNKVIGKKKWNKIERREREKAM